MTSNRVTNLNCTVTHTEIVVNYSTSYSGTNAPTSISMSASINKPGLEIRTYRNYQPDGSFTPNPEQPTGSPFTPEFDTAVLEDVINIFANYETV